MTYAELEGPLKEIMMEFGSNKISPSPYQPFRWLINDSLWDVPEFDSVPRTSSDDFKVSYLKKNRIAGGLPKADYELLLADEYFLQQAAQQVLWEHFSPSLHDDIRSAVKLRESSILWGASAVADSPSRVRDPGLRGEVLAAYHHRCAVCEFDLSIDDFPFGLEAAHIMWPSYGGPDEIHNGLSLCSFHHLAFDRGAWGLERDFGNYRILVSSRLQGRSDVADWLRDYRGKQVRRPLAKEWRPERRFVDWHTENRFLQPPMAALLHT
ncbi:MAG: HNH endonuclease [Gammaproteobacteria bacterium]|nr:HNH endonuclease [Gammaproteobacteria bacterium]